MEDPEKLVPVCVTHLLWNVGLPSNDAEKYRSPSIIAPCVWTDCPVDTLYRGPLHLVVAARLGAKEVPNGR